MMVVPRALVGERVDFMARRHGMSVGLANGCFDLLHVGHVRYLEHAAELVDFLVVGVNSDSRVREMKGPGRPIQPQDERAEIVSALRPVSAVVIFEEPTADALLRELRPDYYFKGTDYTLETLPERATAEEVGAIIEIVGDPKDHASSQVIARLRGGDASRAPA